MALVRTTSDLQRNMGEVCDICKETREPIYVTRNGETALVLMDAGAFEEREALLSDLEHELALFKTLMQSEIDRLEGKTYDWDEIQRERAVMRGAIA